MRVFAIWSYITFVYAAELDYKCTPMKHASARLSFTTGPRGGGFASSDKPLTSSESSHQPVAYNDPVRFGGHETEFYTFTAPEDVFDDLAALQKIAEILKKKTRVIFIKNPENTVYEHAILGLIQQAAEQKTAIYVFNKQLDISGLAEKFSAVQSNTNRKPEVHFVKYRTPEDADTAQMVIQSQYNSLADTDQSYKSDSDPVHDFAAPFQNLFHGQRFQTPNSEYSYPAIFPRLSI